VAQTTVCRRGVRVTANPDPTTHLRSTAPAWFRKVVDRPLLTEVGLELAAPTSPAAE
jgi:hypothetical protein